MTEGITFLKQGDSDLPEAERRVRVDLTAVEKLRRDARAKAPDPIPPLTDHSGQGRDGTEVPCRDLTWAFVTLLGLLCIGAIYLARWS